MSRNKINRKNELLHRQPRSARHAGKPVENEDAGKWSGGEENINRVEREGLKQPLTEDSLGTTKLAQ